MDISKTAWINPTFHIFYFMKWKPEISLKNNCYMILWYTFLVQEQIK